MEEKIIAIINEIKATKGLAPIAKVDAQTRLREDLGLNSFDLAELTVKLEDEFDVDIFEDGLVNTIGEVVAKLKA